MIIGWVIFLVLGGSFILAINKLYKKSTDYRNSRNDIKCFKNNLSSEYQIVNLGSTYSKFAFGAAGELGLNWGDFSLQAQSLEMDYVLFEKNISKIAPQGVVVITIAVCCPLYREAGENYLYYDLLDKNENPSYKITSKLKSFFPLLFPVKLFPKKLFHLIRGVRPYKDIYDTFPQQMCEKSSIKEMENLVAVWKKLFEIKDFQVSDLKKKHYEIMERNCEILKSIIKLCFDKKLRPSIVVPPFSKRLNKYFAEEFKECVLNQTINRAIEGMAVPFLDYQDDKMFQEGVWLFSDGGFRLNKQGSKLFIRQMAMDLKRYNIVINICDYYFIDMC